MTTGYRFADIPSDFKITRANGDRYQHLRNIRRQTGKNYQLVNLPGGGYRLEVKEK